MSRYLIKTPHRWLLSACSAPRPATAADRLRKNPHYSNHRTFCSHGELRSLPEWSCLSLLGVGWLSHSGRMVDWDLQAEGRQGRLGFIHLFITFRMCPVHFNSHASLARYSSIKSEHFAIIYSSCMWLFLWEIQTEKFLTVATKRREQLEKHNKSSPNSHKK